MTSIKLAVIHDMPEEGWTSMDQMGELVTSRVPMQARHIRTTAIRHRLVPVASRVPLGPGHRQALLADRILNRMVLYPRRIRRQVSGRYGLYHVIDHSYAQLVHDLPHASTIVTCHDVDTFRSITNPPEERRSAPFRAMTRRILSGLQLAACVVCGSASVRDDLVRLGLVTSERLHVVPNGIDPAFLAEPSATGREYAAALLTRGGGAIDLLHVGNDIPRKRIDRLFQILSALRETGQAFRLVRVGGPLTSAHRRLASKMNLSVVELPFLDRDVLRAVYARCALLLLPSDREGFGLPVVEAFAAGRPAVVSDIPALREVSAGLARWVTPDDIRGWVTAIQLALQPLDGAAGEYARRVHAASLTWDAHVQGLVPVYEEVLDNQRGASGGFTQCA